MSQVFLFGVLGACTGVLYALSAFSIVLTYRASNVVNFASGAVGMASSFLFWELTANSGWATIPALLVGLTFGIILNLIINVFLMRPLREASNLTRIVATLTVLVLLQSIAQDRYPLGTYQVNSYLPVKAVHFLGIAVGEDRLILIGIAVLITAVTWGIYKYTRFGLATSAIAENRRSLATLGWTPERIATMNWSIGGALAAGAGILLVPIIGLSSANATDLVVPALAAAVIGNFRSFPLTLLGGVVIGILETEVTRYVSTAGMSTLVDLVLILAVVVIRGRRLPLRSESSERLPGVTAGRINPWAIGITVVLGYVLVQFVFSSLWVTAIGVTLCTVIMLQSIVLVTGFAGQISLAQWGIAGLGSLIMARLIVAGVPFVPAIILGGLAGIPIGLAVGLPSLRARGISLAIATLAFAVMADSLILQGTSWGGGQNGLSIGYFSLFGLNMNPDLYPVHFAVFVGILVIIIGVVLANLRRGASGRRMLALRANERAAAALGIDVTGTKLIAFCYAAAIAAFGGAIATIQFPFALFSSGYDPFTSVELVSQSVIGGVGYVSGPALGATGTAGGVVSRLLDDISSSAQQYGPAIFAGITVIALLRAPNGFLPLTVGDTKRLLRKLRIIKDRDTGKAHKAATKALAAHSSAPEPGPDAVLEARGLTVRFGPVTAVNQVDFTLRSGEVLGIIGPNGAGKTTLIDAITGFVPATFDELTFNGEDIADLSIRGRARKGIGRSFQSLELFEDMTVAENLIAASDSSGLFCWLRDLIWPTPPHFTAGGAYAVNEFGLADDLGKFPSELSYGKRRLLAIVRTIAMGPSVIMLDEPAAGLDQREREELVDVIKRLARDWNMAVLLIEHDVSLVSAVSDRMLALDFGAKVILDTPDAVRANPDVIRSYLGVPDESDTDTAGVSV